MTAHGKRGNNRAEDGDQGGASIGARYEMNRSRMRENIGYQKSDKTLDGGPQPAWAKACHDDEGFDLDGEDEEDEAKGTGITVLICMEYVANDWLTEIK
jgi:hypothetical protein